MTDSPAATRLTTPSWLDVRLVLGVLLVLVSVVVGARVLARADTSQPVWVVANPLAAGSVLSSGDVERKPARLFDDAQAYLPAGPGDPAPVGYLLTRAVERGELLPRAALRAPQSGPALREVSVPVDDGHAPADLGRGQLVDVYVTVAATSGTGTSGAATSGAATSARAAGTSRVLSGVPVSRMSSGNRGGTAAVVLSVSGADTEALVSALRAGTVDLVRAPQDPTTDPADLPVGLPSAAPEASSAPAGPG